MDTGYKSIKCFNYAVNSKTYFTCLTKNLIRLLSLNFINKFLVFSYRLQNKIVTSVNITVVILQTKLLILLEFSA